MRDLNSIIRVNAEAQAKHDLQVRSEAARLAARDAARASGYPINTGRYTGDEAAQRAELDRVRPADYRDTSPTFEQAAAWSRFAAARAVAHRAR